MASSTISTLPASLASVFQPEAHRPDFPILDQSINGKPLVYLDNAASSQKPVQVVEAMASYYSRDHANVHRGIHTLSERATNAYEDAREKVRQFIGAESTAEIIFLRGCTEAINLVAHTFGREQIRAGDEMIISALEHHSNLVPWQLLCRQAGATLRILPLTPLGEIDIDQLPAMITPRTRLLAITQVSNALGSITPLKQVIEIAHAHAVPVLADGAQGVPHARINVQELGCDFYAFSGHKMYGPTGIGVLYGRRELLEEMPPFQAGGEMIRDVSFEEVTYNDLPYKFEAGTPDIAGAVGLAAVIDYLVRADIGSIAAHEHRLVARTRQQLGAIRGVRLFGPPDSAAIVSFLIDGVHPHDLGSLLDAEGIAVRAGQHCAHPLMALLGVPGTVRASFGLYNTVDEVDRFTSATAQIAGLFH